jgi:hypothetical protein
MIRAEVTAWLEQRRPVPPPAFGAYLAAAVIDSPEPLPGQLAALGSRLLARVTSAPAMGRELALDLLAADAFVTYAFEAQAEDDVDGLTALAERVAHERAGGGR